MLRLRFSTGVDCSNFLTDGLHSLVSWPSLIRACLPTWRLRGLHAESRGPYQAKSDRLHHRPGWCQHVAMGTAARQAAPPGPLPSQIRPSGRSAQFSLEIVHARSCPQWKQPFGEHSKHQTVCALRLCGRTRHRRLFLIESVVTPPTFANVSHHKLHNTTASVAITRGACSPSAGKALDPQPTRR